MMYLILLVIILVIILWWLNYDNRETFGGSGCGGGGNWFPNMELRNAYFSVEEYDPIESAPLFPKESVTEIESSDQAISNNHYDFIAPSGSYIS
jgi:hypothetical protein